MFSYRYKKIRTPFLSIALTILSTIFIAIAQLFLKKSAVSLSSGLVALLTNYALYIGLLFYGISAILLVIGWKKGELSVLYPLVALSFVWVALGAGIFLGETVAISTWIGIISILLGISSIGIGSAYHV